MIDETDARMTACGLTRGAPVGTTCDCCGAERNNAAGAAPHHEPTGTLHEGTRMTKVKRPLLKIDVEPASPTPFVQTDISLMSAVSPTQREGVGSSGSFLPPPASSLAARRLKNKKQLSLVVPQASTSGTISNNGTNQPTSLLSPAIDSKQQPLLSPALQSMPNSPVPLATFIGVEGSEEEDRTIGRLMMKAQADEMREQMRGERGMRRRSSLAGLSARPSSASSSSATTTRPPASFVTFLRTNLPSAERASPSLSSDDRIDSSLGTAGPSTPFESYPYEHGPREILPGIFLGSEENAKDPVLLRRHGIRFVLNVAKEVECPWLDDVPEEQAKSGNHRRMKTMATVTIAPSPIRNSPSPRPPFVRPTASTPNLQRAYSEQRLEAMSDLTDRRPSPQHSTSSPSLPQDEPAFPRSKRPARTTRSFHPHNPKTGRPAIDYLWLPWGHDEGDLVEAGKLEEAFAFIEQAQGCPPEARNMLVHCQCGVSRSATVVIAWAMREAVIKAGEDSEHQLSQVDGMHSAYSFVKDKSHWIGPNLGLIFQLVAFERQLRGAPDEEDEEAGERAGQVTTDEVAYPSPALQGVHRQAMSNSSTPSSETRLTASSFNDSLVSPTLTIDTKMTSPRSTDGDMRSDREAEMLLVHSPCQPEFREDSRRTRPGETPTYFDSEPARSVETIVSPDAASDNSLTPVNSAVTTCSIENELEGIRLRSTGTTTTDEVADMLDRL